MHTQEEAAPNVDPWSLPGYSEEWTDEDLRDFAAYCARYAATQFPEEDEWANVQADTEKALGPF